MIYKLYRDVFQGGMKVSNYFLGYRMPEYIFGRGFVKRLPQVLKDRGAGKVLVVTDEGLVKLGTAGRLLDGLKAAGIEYALFSSVEQNPTSGNVEEGYRVFTENSCDSVLALGGGSPMDCAKAICAKAAHPKKSVKQMQGLLKVHKSVPMLIVVPTTSGTGSETTLAAVITDLETRRKAPINDFVIIPEFAVLDPELTATMPPELPAITAWTRCLTLWKLIRTGHTTLILRTRSPSRL